MPTASLNGIDVHYERGGDGPRLLFCNGSGATLESSAPVIARFREHFDVVAHDQRGSAARRSRTVRTRWPTTPPTPPPCSTTSAGTVRRRRHQLRRHGRAGARRHVAGADRASRPRVHVAGRPGRASYPLHELAELPPAEAAAIGPARCSTPGSRRSGSPSHPQDRALVEGRAARDAAPKPAERAARRARAAAAPGATTTSGTACRGSTCPTLVAGGRYDGIAPPANSEAIASADPRRRAAAVRGRPPVLPPGPRRLPRHPRLPRRRVTGRRRATRRAREPQDWPHGRHRDPAGRRLVCGARGRRRPRRRGTRPADPTDRGHPRDRAVPPARRPDAGADPLRPRRGRRAVRVRHRGGRRHDGDVGVARPAAAAGGRASSATGAAGGWSTTRSTTPTSGSCSTSPPSTCATGADRSTDPASRLRSPIAA